MKFGLCCSPQLLGFPDSLFQSNIQRLQNAGADYLEFGVGATVPEGDDSEWKTLRDALQGAPLQVEAFNSFLPPHHRITGPEVDLQSVLDYSHVALHRCRELGGEVVVLGSAGARKVPEGFDENRAQEQFVEFGRALGPVAADAGVTVCIEPLNHNEDNLILSVEHGARILDEIAHPNSQLLADLYHIEIEGEPLENVAAAGARIRHSHLADVGRVAPGYAEQGEADYKGFYAALHGAESTFSLRCSVEGSYADIYTQAAPLLKLLRQRHHEARL
jgi:sugar phosphate isomerase/epimerase